MSHRQTRLERSAEGHFPYWVAVPGEQCMGENYHRHRDFCREHNLKLSNYGPSVVWEGNWYSVLRFAELGDAETFMKKFGGEPMHPSERGKGKHWMQWKRGSYKPKPRNPYDFSN